MGIVQPKGFAMLLGDFSNLVEHKLMDCLMRLGDATEIKIGPTIASIVIKN